MGVGVKGAQLTRGDRVHEEIPMAGPQGLRKPVYSSLHDFRARVAVFFDRIPVSHYQGDSTRSPEDSWGQICPASFGNLLLNLLSRETWVNYNPRPELGSLLFQQ